MNIASVPGDQQAAKLEEWLTAYGDSMLRMCYLYLGDHALAEDALQDTFMKVWRGMQRFEGRGGSSPKTWITRIAMNTCKDYRRTAWFKHVDRSKAIEDLPPASHEITDESLALFLDVMELPDKLKQVILLYYFQDMTLVETAKTLGLSRSTVQKRLKKAYSLLHYEPEGRG